MGNIFKIIQMGNIEWETYPDPSFYDMFAVRPVGDRSFNSPRLFHFVLKKEADDFLDLVRKAHVSIPAKEIKDGK